MKELNRHLELPREYQEIKELLDRPELYEHLLLQSWKRQIEEFRRLENNFKD
jgi:hypothetical protein